VNGTMKHALAALASATTLFAAGPTFAGGGTPININGTWTGTATCKGLDPDGTKGAFSTELTARIAGDGGLFAIEFDTAFLAEERAAMPRGLGISTGLCGVAISLASKPGVGSGVLSSFSGAGTPVYSMDFPLDAATLKSIKVYEPNAKGISGTMSGNGTWIPWLTPFLGSCSFKLSRTDTADATPSMDPGLLAACNPT
jgi:hypothetical protein